MGCGFSCGGFGKTFADILTSYERLSMWIALAAVVTCIVSTLILMVSVGIGLGYNYCYVAYSTHQLEPLPGSGNSSGHNRRGDGGIEGDDTRRNLFPGDLKNFRRHPDTFIYQGNGQPLHYVMRRSVTQQVIDTKQENVIKATAYNNPRLKKGDVGQRRMELSIRNKRDALNSFVGSEESNKILNDNSLVQTVRKSKLANLKQRIPGMNSFDKSLDGPLFQSLKGNMVKDMIEDYKRSTFIT